LEFYGVLCRIVNITGSLPARKYIQGHLLNVGGYLRNLTGKRMHAHLVCSLHLPVDNLKFTPYSSVTIHPFLQCSYKMSIHNAMHEPQMN